MSLLPLFPLPNVVLFPGVPLSLHIFEPRYRALVADVLATDRRFGIVLPQAGWESDYDGRPAIHKVGCSGVIVHSERLDDGRYNIVLHGLERFRILDEDQTRLYRQATVEWLPEPLRSDTDQQALGDLRVKLEERLSLPGPTAFEGSPPEAQRLAGMPDDDLVHMLAQYLNLEPIEKQALLERDTVCLRAEALLDLIEMKRLEITRPGAATVLH